MSMLRDIATILGAMGMIGTVGIVGALVVAWVRSKREARRFEYDVDLPSYGLPDVNPCNLARFDYTEE